MKRLLTLVITLAFLFVASSVFASDFIRMEIGDGKSISEIVKSLPKLKNPEDTAVVILTKNGKPIAPISTGLSAASITGTTAANELSFTFNSNDYPWTSEEVTILDQRTQLFYTAIKIFYGSPAYTSVVNVSKDPTLSYAAVYIVAFNEIVLRDGNASDTLCHELIHAFHGLKLINYSSIEESMARACEVIVVSYLGITNYWDFNHSYSADVFYEANNQKPIGSRDGNIFSGFIYVLERYQSGGVVFDKIFLEYPQFFVEFNKVYYAEADSCNCSPDIETIKSIIAHIKPSVEDKVFDDWFSEQLVMNTNPPIGNQMVLKADDGTLYLLNRNDYGWENMLSNIPVSWDIYDSAGNFLYSNAGTTDYYGKVWVDKDFMGYDGRVKINVVANIDGIELKKTFLALSTHQYLSPEVFGILKKNEGCRIVLTHIKSRQWWTTAAINGSFSFPYLGGLKGKFLIEWQDPSTGKWHGRVFTKDAASYFVVMDDSAKTSSRAICSYLGDNVSGSKDIDTYQFSASKGEKITFSLDGGNAEVVLDVVNYSSKTPAFLQTTSGSLPLSLSITIPYAGSYKVRVKESSGEADCCLTLSSTNRAYKNYKPLSNVEVVKP